MNRAVPQWRSLFLYLRVFASCRDFALRRDLPWQVRVRYFRRVLQHVRTFGVFRPVTRRRLSGALYFWCDAYPRNHGVATTAHPPEGAYGEFS